MKDFILNDALSFLNVVEEGSFAAAAQKWGISPSVMSKRISRLESDLGVQLLQRTTRQFTLTEIGQHFYEHCERIKVEINEAAAAVSQTQQQFRGTLRINAPMSFGHMHLVPAVSEFLKQYPDIKVELVLGSQFANFIDNGLDLAIYIKDLPNTTSLKARRIALRHTGVYASPAYLKQKSIPLKPEDLIHHNCLVYQSPIEHGNHKHEWIFHRDKKELKIPVTGNLKANSSQALVKAAIADAGLVRLSSFMVTEEIKNGKLVSVLEDFCLHDIAIHAVYPNQRFLPNKVRVFIDFLVDRFNFQDYWNE